MFLCGFGSLVAKGVSSYSPLWTEGVSLKSHLNSSVHAVTPDSRTATNTASLEALGGVLIALSEYRKQNIFPSCCLSHVYTQAKQF